MMYTHTHMAHAAHSDVTHQLHSTQRHAQCKCADTLARTLSHALAATGVLVPVFLFGHSCCGGCSGAEAMGAMPTEGESIVGGMPAPPKVRAYPEPAADSPCGPTPTADCADDADDADELMIR